MFYVYIVTNKHHAVLYIGVTSNLEGRIFEHRERLIEGFTKRYQVTKLIFYEDYPDPRSAIAREKQLKGWRREKKIALIENRNPRWLDLFDEITAGFDVDLLNREKQEPLIVRYPSTAPRQVRLAQDDNFKKYAR
jgi:putative endonuclease